MRPGDPRDGGGTPAVFVLTGAVRGRAPGAPPRPGVLDVLAFHRAAARFGVSPRPRSGADHGAMPWPATGLDPTVHLGAQPAVEGGTSRDGTEYGRRDGRAEADPVEAARREAGGPVAAPPQPAPFAGGGHVPPAPIRFHQPAVPAAGAQAARASGAPAEAGRPAVDDARAAAPAAPTGRPTPVPGGHDLPPRLLGERVAAPLVTPSGPDAAVERTAHSPRQAAPTAGAAARATAPPSAVRPAQVGPQPASGPPPLVPRQAAAGPVWPVVPGHARSAAVVAERVARAVGRSDAATGPAGAPRAVDEDRGAAQRLPRLRGTQEAEPLTAAALLHEVTRDEVVRALAARMRAVAHDDRFRLGELR